MVVGSVCIFIISFRFCNGQVTLETEEEMVFVKKEFIAFLYTKLSVLEVCNLWSIDCLFLGVWVSKKVCLP